MQQEHEAIKARMLKDFEAMEKLEKEFSEATKILVGRLKGEIE